MKELAGIREDVRNQIECPDLDPGAETTEMGGGKFKEDQNLLDPETGRMTGEDHVPAEENLFSKEDRMTETGGGGVTERRDRSEMTDPGAETMLGDKL